MLSIFHDYYLFHGTDPTLCFYRKSGLTQRYSLSRANLGTRVNIHTSLTTEEVGVRFTDEARTGEELCTTRGWISFVQQVHVHLDATVSFRGRHSR